MIKLIHMDWLCVILRSPYLRLNNRQNSVNHSIIILKFHSLMDIMNHRYKADLTNLRRVRINKWNTCIHSASKTLRSATTIIIKYPIEILKQSMQFRIVCNQKKIKKSLIWPNVWHLRTRQVHHSFEFNLLQK